MLMPKGVFVDMKAWILRVLSVLMAINVVRNLERVLIRGVFVDMTED